MASLGPAAALRGGLVLLGLTAAAGYAGIAAPPASPPTHANAAADPDPSAKALEENGSSPVDSYAVTLPPDAVYAAGTIYYPRGAKGPFGGVAVCPGYSESQADVDWWGPRLASHGFVVLTLDVKSKRGDLPPARADELMAALETLRSESAHQGGPIFGRVDGKRLAIMGHSMGGGATLIAANAHSAALKAAIPFAPWSNAPKAFPSVTVPTLIIAGQEDRIAAPAGHAQQFYASIPDSTPKAYLEFKGAQHGVANGSADGTVTRLSKIEGAPTDEQRRIVSRYVLAWLKLYVDGDERYRPLFHGDSGGADAPLFSSFESSR